MTRKDYVLTARLLSDAIADSNAEWGENTHDAYVAVETVMLVAEKLSEMFENDNANFDVEKFLGAITA
jgi:hypothetical protein